MPSSRIRRPRPPLSVFALRALRILRLGGRFELHDYQLDLKNPEGRIQPRLGREEFLELHEHGLIQKLDAPNVPTIRQVWTLASPGPN